MGLVPMAKSDAAGLAVHVHVNYDIPDHERTCIYIRTYIIRIDPSFRASR